MFQVLDSNYQGCDVYMARLCQTDNCPRSLTETVWDGHDHD